MLSNITLRTRAALFFTAGFLFVWMVVSAILFSRFKNALNASFDAQLKARALLVIQKTNIQPRIVPLPQSGESFIALYTIGSQADTLFAPQPVPFALPQANDSLAYNSEWRTLRLQQAMENGGYLTVIYALPSYNINNSLRQITWLIWIVLPLGGLLACLLAYWLSGKLLMPVRQVIQQANAVNIINEPMLLPEPAAKDELRELIVSFNRMLTRIQEDALRQSAFFASASHELRTPISVMQTGLQVLLQQQEDTAAQKIIYAGQLKEVQQLIKMVNDFLLLSELKAGNVQSASMHRSLVEAITTAVSKCRHMAQEKSLIFKVTIIPEDYSFELVSDEDKLQLILGNLLGNAIKYSPAGSVIYIALGHREAQTKLTVSNSIRSDISPQVAKLATGFYHSKPLHGEGFGLGLWICSQLATLLGMQLLCTINNAGAFEAILQVE